MVTADYRQADTAVFANSKKVSLVYERTRRHGFVIFVRNCFLLKPTRALQTRKMELISSLLRMMIRTGRANGPVDARIIGRGVAASGV